MMKTSPIDLFHSAIRRYDNGRVQAEERQMHGELTGWTVATFHVETDEDVHPDYWEMHPEAEEAVCVLAGGVRTFLRLEGPGSEEAITLKAGNVFIVPRGRWHRLELDGPSDLMSITLRNGTRLEKRAEGRRGA